MMTAGESRVPAREGDASPSSSRRAERTRRPTSLMSAARAARSWLSMDASSSASVSTAWFHAHAAPCPATIVREARVRSLVSSRMPRWALKMAASFCPRRRTVSSMTASSCRLALSMADSSRRADSSSDAGSSSTSVIRAPILTIVPVASPGLAETPFRAGLPLGGTQAFLGDTASAALRAARSKSSFSCAERPVMTSFILRTAVLAFSPDAEMTIVSPDLMPSWSRDRRFRGSAVSEPRRRRRGPSRAFAALTQSEAGRACRPEG